MRNLPDTVTEDQLQKIFEHHGEVTKVVLPSSKPGQSKRDFGFVHFSERSSALKAIEKTETYELDGSTLSMLRNCHRLGFLILLGRLFQRQVNLFIQG